MLRTTARNGKQLLYRTVVKKQVGRTYSAATQFSQGDEINGFSVSSVIDMPRLNMTAISLTHSKTNAKHLHVARQDNNNVFAIGFKTNPPDFTGLPHILEHLTLCGSQNYPVKDPFFKMLTRSLSNFMNAMTGADYTYYPFATTNHKDFRNLQSVYLDAVYAPLLRPEDFRQEGWRLEHQTAEDKESPLIYKGVVFNEMKGQLSNPSYLFYIKYIQSIYPSLQCSGGDPAYITSLKYQDLKKFHDTRYHPSNAFSFSYGDLPLENVLGPLAKSIDKFESADVDTIVHEPIPLESHQKVEIDGPFDPMLDVLRQHKLSLSWIVGDSNDIDSYSWSVLSLLLTSGHSSPFHKALIDSGLGPQYSVNTGLDQQPAKNIFSIGLDGISEESIQKVKDAIFSVLNDVAENGLPQEQLDAVINQVELSNREVQAQFGLDLTHRLFPRFFNDPNAVDLLDSEKRLNIFKQRYSTDPQLFQNLVKMQLLNKPYFEFIMKPSENFEDDLELQEAERLSKAVNALSAEEKNLIFSQTKTSEQAETEAAEQEELTAKLPTLTAEDISAESRSFPVKHDTSSIAPVELFTRETGTQGLTYTALLNNISNVPSELFRLLPLYTEALSNLGTSRHSMAELEQFIRLQTGGVSASIVAKARSISDPRTELFMSLGGTSVDDKVGVVYEVLVEMIQDLDYNNLDKLKQLIQSSISNSTEAMSSSGHRFALGHAAAAVSPTSRLRETLSGIEQIQYMKEISEYSDQQLSEIIVPQLRQLGGFAGTLTGARAGITYTPGEGVAEHQIKEISKFTNSLNTSDSEHKPVDIQTMKTDKTLFQLPFQVSYAGVAVPGAHYLDKDSAALTLLSDLLTHKYMHPEVREKGGAYGGGASYSAIDGIFSFYSYRDPNPINTLNVIKQSGLWASKAGRFSDRNLLEAKLSIFQRLDSPMSPRGEIDSEFVYGISDEIRQQRRSMLLNVGLNDIKQAAEKYLTEPVLAEASTTVVGPGNSGVADEGWKRVDFGNEVAV